MDLLERHAAEFGTLIACFVVILLLWASGTLRAREIGGSGGSLGPPGRLLIHILRAFVLGHYIVVTYRLFLIFEQPG